MSDYTKTTNFTAKDSLPTGNSGKLIKGSDFDTEFDAIATAVATKYDSGDLASEAQAQAETLNTVLMTPLRVANWADANAGMVGDIQALADPGADRLLGWDDSASAVVGFTLGSDFTITGTTISVDDTQLTITESQISDLGTYIESGDTVAALTITAATLTEATVTTLNVGSTASSLTQNGTNPDQIDLEGDTVFSHESGTYNSAKIHFSNGTEPTTEGNDGDIFLVY